MIKRDGQRGNREIAPDRVLPGFAKICQESFTVGMKSAHIHSRRSCGPPRAPPRGVRSKCRLADSLNRGTGNAHIFRDAKAGPNQDISNRSIEQTLQRGRCAADDCRQRAIFRFGVAMGKVFLFGLVYKCSEAAGS